MSKSNEKYTYFMDEDTDSEEIGSCGEILEELEHERHKVGREIHDVLGHDLALLIMKTRRFRELTESSHPAHARLFESLEQDVNNIIMSVRQLLNGLIPIDIADDQFLPQLRRYAQSLSENTGLVCNLECDGDIVIHDENKRLQLLRIIQEAVHNALVHACCSEILIRITAQGAFLDVVVKDNGVGFDSGEEKGFSSYGQKIMSYRARLVGASIDVASSPGHGTAVRCRIPAANLQTRTH